MYFYKKLALCELMNYLIIDLEATGDDPGWHDIVGLSAVLCDANWRKVSEFQTLMYPSSDDGFTLAAERNPGIDLTELKDAPLGYEALQAFEDWIIKSMGLRPDPITKEEHLGKVVLCGFSLVPTYSFLRMAYVDDNINWFFSQEMLDLYTLVHFLTAQDILRTKSSNIKNLVGVCALLGIDRGEEPPFLLTASRLTRRCFETLQKKTAGLEA